MGANGNINDLELAKFIELAGEYGIRVHILHGDSWLPSVANLAALPATGNTTGDIRQTLDTGSPYRWNGTAWVLWITSGVSWGGITGTLSAQTDLQAALDTKMGSGAYVLVSRDCLLTNQINLGALTSGILKQTVAAGVATISILTDNSGNWDTAYTHSQATGNPHGTTKTDLGLGNVDNTSDANKPVSTAQQTAIDAKEDVANKSTSVTTDQASNTKYPSVKSVYDWAVGAFAKYLGDADFYQYSISRTVASGNLTVSLLNYEGNTPTTTKPVKIMIGGVVRTISSVLSFTNVAGFNWGNSGSAELATKEIDWFCYFVWRSGENAVKLTASRYPSATTYGDFSLDSLNEKGNLGNFGSPVSTDNVTNIGRFNAILSGGAGYTWSIPATSVIVNSPIYETRTLSGGTQTGWTANNLLFYYTINGDRLDFSFDANGTSNSTSSYITLPFSAKTIIAHDFALGLTYDNGAEMTTPGRADLYGQYINFYKDSAYGAWTASGSKIIRGQGHYYI